MNREKKGAPKTNKKKTKIVTQSKEKNKLRVHCERLINRNNKTTTALQLIRCNY